VIDRSAAADPEAVHLLVGLFSFLQVRRLRGEGDPIVEERAGRLRRHLGSFLEAEGRLRVDRRGPHLFVNGGRWRPVVEQRVAMRSLWQDLERARLGGWELLREAGAIQALLEIYPRLRECVEERTSLASSGGAGPQAFHLGPGVRALPLAEGPGVVPGEGPPEAERVMRTFVRALAGARSLFRQFAATRIPELRRSRSLVHEMIDCLAEEDFTLLGLTAIQDFDEYTFQHSVHVTVLATALGQWLGLPRRDLADLGVAALFHDIGKLHVPREILHKPHQLRPQEWSLVRAHPLAGARRLLPYGAASPVAATAACVCLEHHMHYDGKGYPQLADWSQGLFARIVSLADCYDAMTASRVYSTRPLTPDSVILHMIQGAGRHFDPDLIRLFVARVGLYPAGSIVRLRSGEEAIVLGPPETAAQVERPRVAILRKGPRGCELAAERDLSAGPPEDGAHAIQGALGPAESSVSVDDLLSGYHVASR